jgi:hypothetical protein
MNKITLACFQDDWFSLIFEPLVLELLMIKVVVVPWICACQWMHICLLYTGDISSKSKIKISKLKHFFGGFQLPESYVWFLVHSQICRLLIKILSFIIGL